MSQQQAPQNSSSSGSSGAGIAAGIGPIVSGIFNNLWAAKERRRSQQWSEKMYDRSLVDNRTNATIQWERETDVQYMMEQYRKAGINPYMVTGQSFNPSVAQSGNTPSSPMAMGNFDFISQIPMAVAQMQMIQAQRKNVEADTTLKSIEADYNVKYGELDRVLGQDIAKQTVANMKETKENINRSTELMEFQSMNTKEQTDLTRYQKQLAAISVKYEDLQRSLDLALTNTNISKNQYELKKITQEIANMRALSAQIKALTEVYKGQPAKLEQEVNKLIFESGYLIERTKTEKEMRPYNKAEKVGKTINHGTKVVEQFWKYFK